MAATTVLKNVPFIYKDGKTYRFSIVQNDYSISNMHNKVHTISVDRRYDITIKIFNWRRTFYNFRPFCEPFEITIESIYSYENTRNKILNEISAQFKKIEEKKKPPQTQMEKIFDGFDGFIGVSNKDKAQYKRVDTINDIIK